MSSVIAFPRNRFLYAALTLAVIAVGIASRRFPGLFPGILDKYPGDALWALMVFFGLGIFLPRRSTCSLAILALTLSFLVEFSQLYQAPWINRVRATTPGHLVLGSTFSPDDLLAYALGIAIGTCLEKALHTLRIRRRPA